MRQRFVATVGDEGYKAFIGTFHQFALKKVLRPNLKNAYFNTIGYTNGFSILDASDSKSLIREAFKSFGDEISARLEELSFDEDIFTTTMSLAKAEGLTCDEFGRMHHCNNVSLEDALEDLSEQEKQDVNSASRGQNAIVYLWWKAYENLCIQNEVIDFDDILVHASKLLKFDEGVAMRLANQIKHFQVDEYQDTNTVQFEIVKTIVDLQSIRSLLVVGDMRQGIYGFRGADPTSMNKIVDYYNAEVIPMNRNYRTAGLSIEAINQFGKTMANQLTDGELKAMSTFDGPCPVVHRFESDIDEADYIIAEINSKLSNGVPPNEIAVIYRNKSVAKTLKSRLEEGKVQFETVGDVDFYSMKDVKVCMGVFRLLANPNDRFALYQIMDELPIGITKANLSSKASQENISPTKYLRRFSESSSARAHKAKVLVSMLDDMEGYIPSIIDEHMAIFLNLSPQEYHHKISTCSEFRKSVDAYRERFFNDYAPIFKQKVLRFFSDLVAESFNKSAERAFKKKNRNASGEEVSQYIADKLSERLARVDKLIDILNKTISDGAQYKEAVDELILLADNTKNNKQDSIFLMTGHASKGLEFDHTYFLGAEQESFFKLEYPDDESLAEEERLFYVGTTRHKKELGITVCNQRFINGEIKKRSPADMLIRFKGTVNDIDHTGDVVVDNQSSLPNADIDTPEEPGPDNGNNRLKMLIQRKARKKHENVASSPVQDIEQTSNTALEHDDEAVMFKL
tara:strand:+ start:2242 stop:4464 length:2223 start_codon:yes stop_codon:yes gene_type:complete